MYSTSSENVHGHLIEKSENSSTLIDTITELAHTICRVLGEPKFLLMRDVIRHLGCEKATAVLDETIRIEKNGGMLKDAGSTTGTASSVLTRRRTPGGIVPTL
jgi:hypothetical protein